MKLCHTLFFTLIAFSLYPDPIINAIHPEQIKIDTIFVRTIDDSPRPIFGEKSLSGLFAIIGAVIGGFIVACSNWWLNRMNKEKERKDKFREAWTSVFYQCKITSGREPAALIGDCAHCLTLLYKNAEVDLEDKLYLNIKAIMEQAIVQDATKPYADMNTLIEDTMSLVRSFLEKT